MDKYQIVEQSRAVFLFIAQVVIFIICLGFMDFIYTVDILPDKEVKENYLQTTCQVTNKQLSTAGRHIHRYRSDFLLSYVANNKRYESYATGNGLDFSFSTDKNTQQAMLDEFDVGQAYDCWYNPINPSIVVLVLRHNWTSTFPLIVPTAIAVITFYYLCRSIIAFLVVARTKARELKKK